MPLILFSTNYCMSNRCLSNFSNKLAQLIYTMSKQFQMEQILQHIASEHKTVGRTLFFTL